MARSLAFWLENARSKENENTEEENIEIELHFNYWSLKKVKINCLDIGVRLCNIGEFDSINFYLPFDYNNLQYQPGLGKTVCTSDGLISAIFNCFEREIKPDHRLGFFDIDFSQSKKERPIRFFTQLLPESEDSSGGVQITEESDQDNKGCILKFPSSLFNFDKSRDGYFRFRIVLSDEDEKSISIKDEPDWALITNHFEKSEIIDFRVNETRNLPDKVKRFITDKSYLKKIHFFLIRDTRSEYKMSHAAYFRCRLLESDLWDRYLNINEKNKNKKQMLIYHWKVDNNEGIDHFSAFAKFSGRRIAWWQALFIILVILILGVCSGLLANYFWKKIENNVACHELTNETLFNIPKENESLFFVSIA